MVTDNKSICQVLKTNGYRTQKEVVDERLKVILKNQLQLKSLRGKLHWEGDIDKMRTDKSWF